MRLAGGYECKACGVWGHPACGPRVSPCGVSWWSLIDYLAANSTSSETVSDFMAPVVLVTT